MYTMPNKVSSNEIDFFFFKFFTIYPSSGVSVRIIFLKDVANLQLQHFSLYYNM